MTQLKKVIDQVTKLYEVYSKEHRATTQPYHYEKVKKLVSNYKYDVNDLLVREPLIEHSGSLPIVATTIYPYINDDEVNLGDALIMLAIHDIGETITGDQITFKKDDTDVDKEVEEALNLLDKSYHDLYLDMEKRRTKTGMFAKSIDKITPDFLDYISPREITIRRFKEQVGIDESEIIPTIVKFKRKYMKWNKFMTVLHIQLINELEIKLKN